MFVLSLRYHLPYSPIDMIISPGDGLLLFSFGFLFFGVQSLSDIVRKAEKDNTTTCAHDVF